MKTCMKLVAFLFLPFAFAANAALVEIVPQSYIFGEATDCGSFCYHDETGDQLIDGQYGTNIWQADLGNGNAYEWLGWRDRSVSVVFDFGVTTLINQIVVGTVQDHLNDVVFPSVYVSTSLDGLNWGIQFASLVVPENSANNLTHGALTLSGLSESARYFVVELQFSLDGPWTFSDEIDFYQNVTSEVPAPGAFMLLLIGLGLLTLPRKRN